jgi:hypothetical protein
MAGYYTSCIQQPDWRKFNRRCSPVPPPLPGLCRVVSCRLFVRPRVFANILLIVTIPNETHPMNDADFHICLS